MLDQLGNNFVIETASEWHKRYIQQAQWTRSLRRYLFDRVKITECSNILEVGSGTGAIFIDSPYLTNGSHFGLDINYINLNLSSDFLPELNLLQADAAHIPIISDSFDIVFCHFLLLWVSNPINVLSEMVRITHPSGVVIVLAEPDYGGRIDYPPPLEQLGKSQMESLRLQGADPLIGRKLASLFSKSGLEKIETGVLGGQWKLPPPKDDWENEWSVLESDLHGLLSEHQIIHLKELDADAWLEGNRILYVPTFYAYGVVPK